MILTILSSTCHYMNMPEFQCIWYISHCCFSVAQSFLTLCDPMDCSMSGLPVPHHLLEFAQVHVHGISDAIWPSYPLTPTSPSASSLSQHQGLFQWVRCFHQKTKILEFQLLHHDYPGLIIYRFSGKTPKRWNSLLNSSYQEHVIATCIIIGGIYFDCYG